MKHKRILVIVSSAALVILAGVISWRLWGQYEVVATVESVQPLICTNSAKDGDCGDGVIKVRTEEGAQKEYKYPPGTRVYIKQAQDEPFAGEPFSLEKGTKVRLTISQGSGKVLEFVPLSDRVTAGGVHF